MAMHLHGAKAHKTISHDYDPISGFLNAKYRKETDGYVPSDHVPEQMLERTPILLKNDGVPTETTDWSRLENHHYQTPNPNPTPPAVEPAAVPAPSTTKRKRSKSTLRNNKVKTCDLCPYATSDVSNYKRHMIVHGIGERKLGKVRNVRKCDLCAYATRDVSNLKRHMIVHGIGERKPQKIFTCDLCPYTAKGSANLNHHMLRAHKMRRLHTCEYCNAKYKTFVELRNHRFEHSNINNGIGKTAS